MFYAFAYTSSLYHSRGFGVVPHELALSTTPTIIEGETDIGIAWTRQKLLTSFSVVQTFYEIIHGYFVTASCIASVENTIIMFMFIY